MKAPAFSTFLLLLSVLLLSPKTHASDTAPPIKRSARIETEHKQAGASDHGYKPDKKRVRMQAKERLDRQDRERRKKHDIGKTEAKEL